MAGFSDRLARAPTKEATSRQRYASPPPPTPASSSAPVVTTPPTSPLSSMGATVLSPTGRRHNKAEQIPLWTDPPGVIAGVRDPPKRDTGLPLLEPLLVKYNVPIDVMEVPEAILAEVDQMREVDPAPRGKATEKMDHKQLPTYDRLHCKVVKVNDRLKRANAEVDRLREFQTEQKGKEVEQGEEYLRLREEIRKRVLEERDRYQSLVEQHQGEQCELAALKGAIDRMADHDGLDEKIAQCEATCSTLEEELSRVKVARLADQRELQGIRARTLSIRPRTRAVLQRQVDQVTANLQNKINRQEAAIARQHDLADQIRKAVERTLSAHALHGILGDSIQKLMDETDTHRFLWRAQAEEYEGQTEEVITANGLLLKEWDLWRDDLLARQCRSKETHDVTVELQAAQVEKEAARLIRGKAYEEPLRDEIRAALLTTDTCRRELAAVRIDAKAGAGVCGLCGRPAESNLRVSASDLQITPELIEKHPELQMELRKLMSGRSSSSSAPKGLFQGVVHVGGGYMSMKAFAARHGHKKAMKMVEDQKWNELLRHQR